VVHAGIYHDVVYGDEEDDFVVGGVGIDKCVYPEFAICDAVE
jgi:hypothetical protein